ncbi:GNAT family N-acetyltransferase [Danxiaibacter flavus]|uniref:GNAT family N-acetyltransferase n=1 Tax=Danxiaibacter flavus TaxID=3049108 RepID=A0ABV3ZBH6_9BACT|nr:GNAT family N-acetyltransferase [Chitinophagaceae bacterium DXS]
MVEIALQLDEKQHGAFTANEGDEQIGEMVVSIKNDELTVYHTEVAPKAEGKGVAKSLLDTMVKYARENALKVIPLCPYVHLQFRRHESDYADLWKK